MKLTEAKLKEMIKEELKEAYKKRATDSLFNYNDPEVSTLVYINKTDNPTPPIPRGYVRVPYQKGRIGQGINRTDKRHREVLKSKWYVFEQPGFLVSRKASYYTPEGAERKKQEQAELEAKRQEALAALGPDEPDKNVDWNAWYTWASARNSINSDFVYNTNRLANAKEYDVKIPPEERENYPPSSTRVEERFPKSKRRDGIIFPGDEEPQYMDLNMFVLKGLKLVNKYGAIVDFNGKTIAPKSLQARLSKAQ